MIKIEQVSNKYKISYGQRIKNFARDEKEVINAVKHYFAMKHRKNCPSCREDNNK